MKKQVRFFATLILSFLMFSCASENDSINLDEIGNNNVHQSQEIKFPEADESVELTGLHAERVNKLLEKFGSNIKNELLKINITQEEYNEIKQYTDELVAGCTSEMDKYAKIYKDVRTVKYNHSPISNDPYVVFKLREGLCQGYADLLSVMLHTQNILGFTTNGYYNPSENGQPYGYGHAWSYVYCEGVWYVCDPTNSDNYTIEASNIDAYKHLVSNSFDANLYEDEHFIYNFYQGHINVRVIKESDTPAVVPYSIEGYKVTSIFPEAWNINDDFKNTQISELYIGKNIKTIYNSDYYISLSNYSNISAIHIDPEHQTLQSYSNAIYEKNYIGEYMMVYVAPATTFLEVKYIKSFDKECKLKNLQKVEIIVFPDETTNIDAYAIENCPNLRQAYVPTSANVATGAFYNVASNFQLIRGEYTNIPEIKE